MEDESKRREMTTGSRQAAFCTLYSHLKDGKRERGALKTVADMFPVDKSTMSRFWREMQKNRR